MPATTSSTSLFARTARAHAAAAQFFDRLQPLAALAIRLYVARVFLASGLTKLDDWNLTVALFENEYRVPLLSPAVAALAGTAAELVLPVLLLLGLSTRFAALALFAFNVGVEIGQLAFVALILLTVRAFKVLELHWSKAMQLAPGYVVGTLGAFWTIQRVMMMIEGG